IGTARGTYKGHPLIEITEVGSSAPPVKIGYRKLRLILAAEKEVLNFVADIKKARENKEKK
ncbi:unnamed protein product, partial [marine sediment metagenome]